MGLEHDLPDTGETPAGVHVVDVLGARLEAAAEEEDKSTDQDGHLAAEHVTDGAGKHGAEEGAAGKDGDNCAAVRKGCQHQASHTSGQRFPEVTKGLGEGGTYVSSGLSPNLVLNEGEAMACAMTPRS